MTMKIFQGPLGLLAFAVFALFGILMLQVVLEGDVEARDTGIAMAVVIGGLVQASRMKPKAPLAPVAGHRRDLELPEYVLNWRYFRWPLIAVGLALSALFGTEIFLAMTLAAVAIWEASVSRRYHAENRVRWEIAFYSEEDGFFDGDGDGDGD